MFAGRCVATGLCWLQSLCLEQMHHNVNDLDCKVDLPVLSQLNSMPWRHMEQWRFSSTITNLGTRKSNTAHLYVERSDRSPEIVMMLIRHCNASHSGYRTGRQATLYWEMTQRNVTTGTKLEVRQHCIARWRRGSSQSVQNWKSGNAVLRDDAKERHNWY
jgi:hypothetical protein